MAIGIPLQRQKIGIYLGNYGILIFKLRREAFHCWKGRQYVSGSEIILDQARGHLIGSVHVLLIALIFKSRLESQPLAIVITDPLTY